MSIRLAVVISVLGTCMNSAGLILQKQGVAQSGAARLRYLGRPRWLLGLALMAAGWGLYVFSIDRAPLYVIQPVQGAGIAVFVLFSLLVLKERVRPGEWAAIAGLIAGALLLGSAGGGEKAAPPPLLTLVVFAGTCALISAGLFFVPWKHTAKYVLHGMGSGLLIGCAAVFTKTMTASFMTPGAEAVFGVSLALTIAGNLGGLLLMQSGFAGGRAIVVVTLQTALTGVVPVAAAFTILGEKLPSGVQGILVILGLAAAVSGSTYLARFAKTG